VRQFTQDLGNLGWNWRATDPGEEGGICRLDHYIRSDTGGAIPGAVDLPHHDRDDAENHDHLDRDCKNADEGPQWAMQQIPDYQLIHPFAIRLS